MNCPNCGKSNAESASFCIFCGSPLEASPKPKEPASRFKGSLSGSLTPREAEPKAHTEANVNDVNEIHEKSTHSSDSAFDLEASALGSKSSGLKSTMGKPVPSHKVELESVTYTYCKKCGKKLRAGEECPDCIASGATPPRLEKTRSSKKSKTWLLIASVAAILILVIGVVSAIPKRSSNTTNASQYNQNDFSDNSLQSSNHQPQATTSNNTPLSSSCDFILCAGTDRSGNTYELVANQTESSQGFEISVGVIKNNTWLYPLSSDFPFLGDDGLFHVSVSVSFVGDDAGTGTSLLHPNRVVDKLYFIDSGAFLMECYRESAELFGPSETYYLIFSCDALSCKKIDCAKTNLLYRYSEPTFVSGQVESYGQIFTDNGKMIMYEETSGTSSGWTEDQVFRWDILDTKALTTTTIASNVKGIRPKSVLSEGLFFCTDKRFYNGNGQAVVDLTEYGIDVWNSGDIFFEGGTCTFEVKNSLGTRFLITIDSSGSMISEQQA